jgi:fatty-acyl-CoA synthase
LPKIDAVAIIGVPDEKWGETGKAYIQCKPGEWITIEEVRGILAGNVARYKYPTLMETVDALPTTVWGKIKKAALKQRHLKNSDSNMSYSYRRYNSHRYG